GRWPAGRTRTCLGPGRGPGGGVGRAGPAGAGRPPRTAPPSPHATAPRARVRRLDELARGLAKELAAVQATTLTGLLYRERRGYLEALHQALGGLEGARVTLARALRRLEG